MKGGAHTAPKTALVFVVDLEATCWRPGSEERARQAQETEVIELGVVLTTPALKGEPLGTFERFVRPTRHPQLTPFCCELTGITQAQVERAEPLPEVLEELWRWVEEQVSASRDAWEVSFASWGPFDRGLLKRQAKELALWLPEWSYIDVKRVFERDCKRKRLPGGAYGLRKAMESLAVTVEGSPHRALSDALGAWRVWQRCADPSRLSPEGAQLLSLLKAYTKDPSQGLMWSRQLSPPLHHKPAFERATRELLELDLALALPHGRGLKLSERASFF
jgi:inhibitor of KinA sporulation pathway (predicted exonuclease)